MTTEVCRIWWKWTPCSQMPASDTPLSATQEVSLVCVKWKKVPFVLHSVYCFFKDFWAAALEVPFIGFYTCEVTVKVMFDADVTVVLQTLYFHSVLWTQTKFLHFQWSWNVRQIHDKGWVSYTHTTYTFVRLWSWKFWGVQSLQIKMTSHFILRQKKSTQQR